MKLGEGSELVQAYTVTKKASNPPLSAPKVLTSQKPFPEVGMDLENSPTPLCATSPSQPGHTFAKEGTL